MAAAGLQHLVDALSAELERPVLLDDAALRPVAFSRQWGPLDSVRTDSILSRGASPAVRRALFEQGIAAATGLVRTRPVPELGMEERVCVPARHGGELRGYLWFLARDEPIDAVTASRLEAAAARAGELLAAEAPRRSWLRDESELVGRLVSGRAVERSEAVTAAGRRQLLPDGPFVVLLIGSRTGRTRPDWALGALGARLSVGHALAGAAADEVVVLLSLADPVLSALRGEEVASRMLRVLLGAAGPGADVAVGQSSVVSGLDGAAGAVHQARIALRAARAGSGQTAHAAWEALGPDRLVGQLPGRATEDLPPGLNELLHEHPELSATLEAFLDAAGDVQRTAAALNLHRSGVYYRLRRIEDVTGLDLRAGEDRLLAHLALRLHRLP